VNGFPTLQIRLIVACQKTAARRLLKRSSHLLAFQLVLDTSSKLIVQTFLATKILCSGLLNGPLPYGTLLEVSPEERHTSIGCSSQMQSSAMGVTRVSQG
jgi:hypothetical protein